MIDRRHQQVPVKVTAYVDSGIRPLVEILNRCDGFWSFQSCEGSDDEFAYVELLHKGIDELKESDFMVMANAVYRLVAKLSQELAQQQEDDEELIGLNVRIALQWCNNWKRPSIRVELPHDCINTVVRVLSRSGICGKTPAQVAKVSYPYQNWGDVVRSEMPKVELTVEDKTK